MPVFDVADFKRVLRVYLVILEEMVRGPLSLAHLSDPASEDTSRDAAEESLRWLQVLDTAITPARLRVSIQQLQPTEEDVQAVVRFLACKSPLEDDDRERLEFLLAYAFRAHGDWEYPDALTRMAQEIHRWLQDSWFDVSPAAAHLFRQLEEVCQGVLRCASFAELVPSRLIERGRALKKSCGSEIALPAVLAAVTLYNLRVGRHFKSLMDRAAHAEDFPEEALCKDYRIADEEFRRWIDLKVNAVLQSSVPAPLPAATVPAKHRPSRRWIASPIQPGQRRSAGREQRFQAGLFEGIGRNAVGLSA